MAESYPVKREAYVLAGATMTLGEIEQEVQRLDPQIDRDEDSYRIAVLLLSSVVIGTDIEQLVAFTGLSEAFVAQTAGYLYESKVWTEEGIDVADWFEKDGGGVAFWLTVAVGRGLVKRTVKVDD